MSKQSLFARIMGTQTPSPAADIRAALAELDARHRVASERIRAIEPYTLQTGAPGPERQRVALEGTPAELVQLDRELAELRAEVSESLPAQSEELRRRLDAAEAAEALESLPEMIRNVRPALDKLQAVRAAAATAEAEAREAANRIAEARTKAGDDSPGLDLELAGTWCDALGFAESDSPTKHNSSRLVWFTRLTGQPSPESQKQWDSSGRLVKPKADRARLDDGAEASEPDRPERRPAEFLARGGASRRESV